MRVPKRVLIVSSEFGVDARGNYRPGGLQQFSRCVFRALASSNTLTKVDGWGLLDEAAGADWMNRRYLATNGSGAQSIAVRGFAGNRQRMVVSYAAHAADYDLAMFLHIGVGRLALLNPRARTSLWLVGAEVRRKLRWFEKLVVKRADPLLSISEFTTGEMRRRNPSLPGGQTVHLCTEPNDPWTDTPAAPPPAYDPADREPAVLVVGRMENVARYKGHEQLIAGWPSVVERCPRAQLWIAGIGDDESRLRALAQALPGGVRASVRFLGRLSHVDLERAYARARVFAMPSTGEGFGLVFVEAMRAGLPCICSLDAAQEIVVDGETGFVVEQRPSAIADACAKLLTDNALAARMAKAGRERFAQSFTFDAFRGRLLGQLGLGDG